MITVRVRLPPEFEKQIEGSFAGRRDSAGQATSPASHADGEGCRAGNPRPAFSSSLPFEPRAIPAGWPNRQLRTGGPLPPSVPQEARGGPRRYQAMQSQLLSAKECVGSGPGLKTTPAVVDLARQGGRSRPRRLRAAGWAPGRLPHCPAESAGSYPLPGPARVSSIRLAPLFASKGKRSSAVWCGLDRRVTLQQDIAGVQALVETHGGRAGHGLSIGHGPLDGRGAAVFGKQRGVQVEVAPAAAGSASIPE